MCTALNLKTNDSYFGRNLDLEYSYNETVTITPRNYPIKLKKHETIEHHYAMIGMAYVLEDYPLYYDAVNECGLAMAGLNFPGNAVYYDEAAGKDNITPSEFILYILGKCANIEEAKATLENMNLVNIPFDDNLPLSPLHWIISDKNSAITVETVREGMKVYDNPVGVLTNNPTFDFMMLHLSNYKNLTNEETENRFSNKIDLPAFCRGLGAVGLPGDYSSMSRFVKTSFLKLNSFCGKTENESVGQFFHLLGAVEMPKGAVHVNGEIYDITVYSSCMNQDKGIYYYTTYSNRQINAVDMNKENLESKKLVSYKLKTKECVNVQN